ncbi:MAG: GNAT family N-acetyltransferase [Clostridiaceae bacterium]|jgi:RimJ/RimL family protein N-acetyltransferase|nr:GNAT family N-acetyltransferase [Clostridiaceae bacterium]
MDLAVSNRHVRLYPFGENNLSLLRFWYRKVSSYGYATGGRDPEDIILRQNLNGANYFASGIYTANGENCIGLISGEFKTLKDPVLWIRSFFIDKRWQRKRYGTYAFQLLVEHSCRHYHIKRVYVSVLAENKTGVAFWKSLGFNCVKKINNTKFINGHGIFILEKDAEK